MTPALLSRDELERLLGTEFPQAFSEHRGIAIEAVWLHGCRIRQTYDERSLRPGGTISGPTLMALADFAMYVGILASIGWAPLTVTTSFNINFFRKPAQRDLLAECRLLKVGKRLAVAEATMISEGATDPVAHATATYSIPSR